MPSRFDLALRFCFLQVPARLEDALEASEAPRFNPQGHKGFPTTPRRERGWASEVCALVVVCL